MILFSQFGYAWRHCISYNPKTKPGNLRLWSPGNSLVSLDPSKNGDSPLSEFVAHQFKRSSIFGANIYVDFSIGNYSVFLVNIRHNDNTGIITLKEIDELEIITRSILTNLGYSNQEIAGKEKNMIAQSSIQEDENAKNTR